MDLINNLMLGFGVALQPINLLYCFIGVFIGTLVGMLPGIGPVAAMSLLLPMTFRRPTAGIIMLAGIYYGAMYGGSTTAILVNIPGEAASVVTCLDGHEMAKQGRAGAGARHRRHRLVHRGHAWRILGLMLVAPTLARFAVEVRPGRVFQPDGAGPRDPDLPVARLAAQGADHGLLRPDARARSASTPIGAAPRLTFDRMELVDGVGLVPIVMGLFGIAEILVNLEQKLTREMFAERITGLLPSRQDWKESAAPLAAARCSDSFSASCPAAAR